MQYFVPDSNRLVIDMRAADGGFRSQLADSLAHAYQSFCGCFLTNEECPSWARRIEQYERDTFRDTAPFPRFSEHGSHLAVNSGKGKRACNWNFAMALDPKAFLGYQDYGNCTFASMGWKTMTMIMGVRILGLKVEERWRARHGTVWYCTRGHCGQGSALSQAARSVVTYGLQVLDQYDGYDFRDEDYDEQCGNSWCRSGPPRDLVAQTQTNKHKAVSLLDDSSPEAWMDVVYNGGSIHTGSVTTAAKNGDPVSSFTSVGPHAQSIIGYDDTEEFRDWYYQKTNKRLTDPVVIFSQTWGDQQYVVKNWPDHLWGRRPQGAFVLPLPGVIDRMGADAYAYGPDADGFKPHPIEWKV